MNTTQQQPSTTNDLGDILGLHEMSHEEQDSFLTRVGELIIESAVLRFVIPLEEADQENFNSWLYAQQFDEALLQSACEIYPRFAEILTEEMDAFQGEAKRLFGVS
jgi:hypothetical protein